MPVGLQVFNDSNILQIDGEYQNLCFHSKATVTCDIPVTNGTVTFYISAAQNYSGITNLTIALRSSSNCVVYWVSSTQYVICSNTNGASVTVYLFGDPPPAVSSYGLHIYNAAGVLVFDAVRQYMRVVGMEVLPDTTQEGTFNYPAGRTYAVVLSGGYWARIITTGAPAGSPSYYLNEWKLTAASFSGTTLTMHGIHLNYSTASGPSAGWLYENKCKSFALVLDVTNY